MQKSTVKKYFGTYLKAASTLGIAPASVSLWPDPIPKGRALELAHITGGALEYDPTLYAESIESPILSEGQEESATKVSGSVK